MTFSLTLPPLHGDPTLLTGPLWTTWRIDPTVALGVFGLVAAYLLGTGSLKPDQCDGGDCAVSRGQKLAFLTGAATLLLALGPPIEDWAVLLVSGHMLQHLLLLLATAPLLLLGTPAWLLRPLLRSRVVARVGYLLTRPLVAFALAGLVLIAWHVPVLYDAALRSQAVHILQHQLYLVTGVLAWWPVLGPLPEWPRLSPGLQCLYLIAQTLPGGIVGSFLTVADSGLYDAYATVPRMWGLARMTDQQIAGLMMWVGANTIYLLLITVIFFRWAGREETAEHAKR